MSKFEIVNGVKYINGYKCNDAGQPITMSNGYGSEDEKEASLSYMRDKMIEKEKATKAVKTISKNEQSSMTGKYKKIYNISEEDER